jgi:signal transduction histidine kinase
MAELRPGSQRATDLARQIARRTAVAWGLGVLILAGLSIVVAATGFQRETDSTLRAHALAVYGLAWFDDAGFHDEALLRESELLEGAVSLSIATPEGTIFGPPVDPSLVDAVRESEEIWQDRGELRLLALPTFDEQDRWVGAIVATTPPATAATVRFSAFVLGLAALLAVVGVVFSQRLSARILSELLATIEERERILAGAAHELRTPMARLKTLLDGPRSEELLRETVDNTAALVDRLLTWSRLADVQPTLEPVRLDLLIELCLDEGEPLTAEPSIVQADPRLLEVAVRNLIENARVHGGGIESVDVAGGRLTVRDRGPGIVDVALLAPFHKGPDSPGSGLGLALVRRIADAHGGTLELGPPIALVLPAED